MSTIKKKFFYLCTTQPKFCGKYFWSSEWTLNYFIHCSHRPRNCYFHIIFWTFQYDSVETNTNFVEVSFTLSLWQFIHKVPPFNKFIESAFLICQVGFLWASCASWRAYFEENYIDGATCLYRDFKNFNKSQGFMRSDD